MLYLLLAAEGGVRERPYLKPLIEYMGEVGEDRLHSSVARLLRPGEAQGLWGALGEEGEAVGSNADSDFVLWKRGAVERSISAADILKLVSERLPFFRRRALKVSLLVDDFRMLRWMEPVCLDKEDARPGDGVMGVVGVVGVEGVAGVAGVEGVVGVEGVEGVVGVEGGDCG